VSNLLCSLIKDICSNRHDTPLALRKAYDQSNCGQQRPTTSKLIELLKSVVDGFENVYIIVDAVDECPKSDGERAKLLGIIQQTFDWRFAQLHLLVSSRTDVDIKNALDDIPQGRGSLQVVNAQGKQCIEDIEKFLANRLEDSKFSRWSPNLRQEVKIRLGSQADGMYVEFVLIYLMLLTSKVSIGGIATRRSRQMSQRSECTDHHERASENFGYLLRAPFARYR
jgi:hypothetical protein